MYDMRGNLREEQKFYRQKEIFFLTRFQYAAAAAAAKSLQSP